MNVWFTAKSLVGVIGMPTTDRRIRSRLDANCGQKQKRKAGRAYEYHFDCLPPETRNYLVKNAAAESASVEQPAQAWQSADSELWHDFENATKRQQDDARRKLEICQYAMNLTETGVKFVEAIRVAADESGVSFDRVRKWFYESPGLRKIPQSDWLPALLSRRGGARVQADISPDAWGYFLRDYLRPEQPCVSECYRRMREHAKSQGWVIPSLITIQRRVKTHIPAEARILRREGAFVAQQTLVPAQRRTRGDLNAMEIISGDGHDARVFCHLPDGTVLRPVIWVFQDVLSSAIVGYSIDLSENTEMLTIALFNMLKTYGIPQHIVFDRGSAALSEVVTGRTYRPVGRNKTKRKKFNPDEVEGVLTALGVKTTWTKVIDDNAGRKGNARAKPVERFFHSRAGIGQFERDPAFEGAYTGANVTAKPANYGSATVPVDLFIQKFDQFVHQWNNEAGRRSEMARGKYSYQQVFNNSYQASLISRATEQQLRMCLLRTELTTVRTSGVIELKTGQINNHLRNRYHSKQLVDFVGCKVSARFNPFELHAPVYVYADDGRYIGSAELLEDAGFNSTSAARHQRLLQTTELARASFVTEQLGLMPEDEFRKLAEDTSAAGSGLGGMAPGVTGVTQIVPELPSNPAQFEITKRAANGDAQCADNFGLDIDVDASLNEMAGNLFKLHNI